MTPRRYGVADGDFARVTTDYGQCILKVVVSERQQRGMLFAPIHWSERMLAPRASARWWRRSPIRFRPAREQGDAGVDRAVRIRVSRLCVVAQRSNCRRNLVGARRVTGGFGYLFADNADLARWQCLRSAPAAISPNTAISAAAFIAPLRFRGDRIETCLFVGPAHDAGDWNVVKSCSPPMRLNDVQRRMLLSGKSVDGLASAGPIVCACFGVGRTTICDASRRARALAAEIGAQLKAGTNCGSCIPELKRLIAEAGTNVPPRGTQRWLARRASIPVPSCRCAPIRAAQ
jgi:assimilatory nitrate reductase catalytic subunit